MTDSDSKEILMAIQQISHRLDHLETRLDKVDISLEKADAYRQGTQWVVNLAFSLIVATTIGIILRFVFGS